MIMFFVRGRLSRIVDIYLDFAIVCWFLSGWCQPSNTATFIAVLFGFSGLTDIIILADHSENDVDIGTLQYLNNCFRKMKLQTKVSEIREGDITDIDNCNGSE
jgi:hypothetical protein